MFFYIVDKRFTFLRLNTATYLQALYHALPMKYVTVGKLQSKLSGEANQHTVKKLLDRMAQDGYIKNSGKKRLGE